MTNKNRYPRLRNGKLEGGSLPSNYIFLEEKKEIWVLCESSITAMGIRASIKSSFPDYELCLCNRETFLRLGGKL